MILFFIRSYSSCIFFPNSCLRTQLLFKLADYWVFFYTKRLVCNVVVFYSFCIFSDLKIFGWEFTGTNKKQINSHFTFIKLTNKLWLPHIARPNKKPQPQKL